MSNNPTPHETRRSAAAKRAFELGELLQRGRRKAAAQPENDQPDKEVEQHRLAEADARRKAEEAKQRAEEEQRRHLEEAKAAREQADEPFRVTIQQRARNKIQQVLFDNARTSLYRDNTFRRLRYLTADAQPEDIVSLLRESDIPDAQIIGAFPLSRPSGRELNSLCQRLLQDPPSRLIDTFFWFWPGQPGQGLADPALRLLFEGNAPAALAHWKRDATAVARHNLAIYQHVQLLDRSSAILDGTSSPGEAAPTRQEWTIALDLWRSVLADEAIREWLHQYVRRADDARLSSISVTALVEAMPQAIQQINAVLGQKWAQRGFSSRQRLESDAEASVLIALAEDQAALLWDEPWLAGSPQAAIDRVCRPLREHIDNEIEGAGKGAKLDLPARLEVMLGVLREIEVDYRTIVLLAHGSDELKTVLLDKPSDQFLYLVGVLYGEPSDAPACADLIVAYRRLRAMSVPAGIDIKVSGYLNVCEAIVRDALKQASEKIFGAANLDTVELWLPVLLLTRNLVNEFSRDGLGQEWPQIAANAMKRLAERVDGGSNLDLKISAGELLDKFMTGLTLQSGASIVTDELLDFARRIQRERAAAVVMQPVSRAIAKIKTCDGNALLSNAKAIIAELRPAMRGFGDLASARSVARTFAEAVTKRAAGFLASGQPGLANEAYRLAAEFCLDAKSKKRNAEAIEKAQTSCRQLAAEQERLIAEGERQLQLEQAAGNVIEKVQSKLYAFHLTLDADARLDLARREILPDVGALLTEFGSLVTAQQAAVTVGRALTVISEMFARDQRFTLAIEARELADQCLPTSAAEKPANLQAIAAYRHDREEVRHDVCFFCGKVTGGVQHPCPATLQAPGGAEKLTIKIPRCGDCANWHGFAALGLLGIPVLALILVSNWLGWSGGVLGVMAIAAGTYYARVRQAYTNAYFALVTGLSGRRAAQTMTEYKEVADLRRRGWR